MGNRYTYAAFTGPLAIRRAARIQSTKQSTSWLLIFVSSGIYLLGKSNADLYFMYRENGLIVMI